MRENPPLWLAWSITDAGGQTTRWGGDEPDARRIPKGTKLTTQSPGGYKSGDCELTREDIPWPDLNVLDDVRVYGAGNRTAFEGRLAAEPRGLRSISPSAEGYAARLRDNPAYREIWRAIDLTQWGGASSQRKINLLSSSIDNSDPSVIWDQTSNVVDVGFDGAWSRQHRCEAWYNAGGIPIGAIYHGWTRNASVSNADTNWTWYVYLSDDDVVTTSQNSGDLRAAGPGTGTLTASGVAKKFAMLYLNYGIAAGSEGTHYSIMWRPVVYGAHGVTPTGTEPDAGFTADQVLEHVLPILTPDFNLERATGSSIQPGTFVIPHLVFPDLSTAEDVITAVNRFEQYDWFVYDKRTFIFRPANEYGRRWLVRLGDGVEPRDTGEQSDDLYNGAVVVFRDETGTTRTVGPPSSNCEYTDSSLEDTSSDNPVNAHGIGAKWTKVDASGTLTLAGATQLGALVLEALGRRVQRGDLDVSGWAQDEYGAVEPVWMIRSGDVCRIIDSSRPDEDRRIIGTAYDEDQQFKNTLTLDAPPNRMDALQERLGVVVTPLGL